MEYTISSDLRVRETHRVHNSHQTCWVCIEPFGYAEHTLPWEITNTSGRRICRTSHPVHLNCLQRMLYHMRMQEQPILCCGVCRVAFSTNLALAAPYSQETEERLHFEYHSSTQRTRCIGVEVVMSLMPPCSDENRLRAAIASYESAKINSALREVCFLNKKDDFVLQPDAVGMLDHGRICFRMVAMLTLIQSGSEKSVLLMCSDLMSEQALDVLAEQKIGEKCEVMLKSCPRCIRTGWTNFTKLEPGATVRIELFGRREEGEPVYLSRTTRVATLFRPPSSQGNKRLKAMHTRRTSVVAPTVDYVDVQGNTKLGRQGSISHMYFQGQVAALEDGSQILRVKSFNFRVRVDSGCCRTGRGGLLCRIGFNVARIL